MAITLNATETSNLYQAIAKGNAKGAEIAATEALAAGIAPHDLVTEHLIPAMKSVDVQFPCKDCAAPELCYVPEQLIVNHAIQAALRVIRPAIDQNAPSNGLRVVIATVEGDRCSLGYDLVAPLLREVAGEVMDLGVGVPNQELIRVAGEKEGTILVLYTRKMSSLAKIKLLKDELVTSAPLCNSKIVVVGQDISLGDCQTIGVDGFAGNTIEAISVVSSLADLN